MSAANASVKANVPGNRLPANRKKKNNFLLRFWKTRFLFALFLPALIYYIMFKYVPMWGVSIAFFRYNVIGGLQGSKFVGLMNLEVFFRAPGWLTYVKNTLALSVQALLISFPLTILFSLLLNEIRNLKFKRVVQTVSYLPHFLSMVVVVALMRSLCDPTTGAINLIIKALGGKSIYFFTREEWFRPLYLISGIWSGLGWGTIIYLSAISSVDPGLYEAARLDGAGRWRQMWNITLPSIAPTVSTMFIMKVGNLLDDSLVKVLLMQEPSTYGTSQTLGTYVYEVGMGGQYGMSTAVDLLVNVVNLGLLFAANYVSKKMTENSIF